MLTVSRRPRFLCVPLLVGVSLIVTALGVTLATPAAACPDWRLNGQTVTYDRGQLDRPQSFSFMAGGSHSLSQCPTPGVGWAAAAPHLTMGLRGQSGDRDLVFRVEASCDTVLLINDATAQWHFNDDSQGLNPGLTLRAAPDGVYDIWIGTYGQSSCQATLSVQLSGPGQGLACPSMSLVGTQLSPSPAELRAGLTVGAMAGGANQLRECPMPGTGYVDETPQFTLNLPDALSGADLDFRVTAGCDTVMLVNDAEGNWHFNDDTDGLNPRLNLRGVLAGSFNIWVGTYNPTPCSAELQLTASGGPVAAPVDPTVPAKPGRTAGVQPTTPPSQAPQPTDQASLPDPGNMMGFRDRVGAVLAIELTGAAAGGVWGTDVYSDDSSLARAAVHAGVLRVGETGVVHVEVMPGQTAYQGSERFGVTTSNWGTWAGSFRFVRASSASAPASASRFELVVVPQGITFDAARQRAEAMGGHLATITSEAESREVWAVANVEAAWITDRSGYSVGPWLGGYRVSGTPGWAWITGEPWSYTAWSPGQPDNWRGIETHLNLFSPTSQPAPMWNDAAPTSTLRGFILERPSAGAGSAASTTGLPVVQMPAAAGEWSLVGNSYRGRLVLAWSGSGWTGHVRYDVHGRDEPLENISFDISSGRIEFTRPIPGATQIYRGVLTGGRIEGQFNQNGGGYIYNWSATR